MRTLDLAMLGTAALAGCLRTPPETPPESEAATSTEVTLASYGQQDVPRQVLLVLADLQRVSFGEGSAALGPQAKDALGRAARILGSERWIVVELRGQSDERGMPAGTRDLALDRALAVEAYLESRGLDPDRIVVLSAGDVGAARTAPSKRVWSLNRRVEFRVIWGDERELPDI